ncbi:MAG: MarR family transcriptional regulator [Epulopiscium sp.]|jgi:DNA-binding MarR family transcriptional regulator|nr:MarR family transcriptional regulator [Candidatus Epulonipiscium sp.]
MADKKTNEVSLQFLGLIINLTHWLHGKYFKEFNINGKGNTGLTDRQFTILILVHQFKQCTLSDLQRHLNVSSSSLSIGVSKLVKEGYLIRNYPSEEDDRRKIYLSMTQKGVGVLTEVYERIIYIFGEFYESLTSDKKKDFEEGISKLNAVISE